MARIKKAQIGTFLEVQAFKRQAEIDRQKMNAPGKEIMQKPMAKRSKPVAKDGKWIQKATASIKRRGTEGKCTPITKPGCTGRAKALAKTFKKMAKARKNK